NQPFKTQISSAQSFAFLTMVARRSQAHHNLKVTGSNPVPATKFFKHYQDFKRLLSGGRSRFYP
ncbi:hypothetical protein, partial [Phyllobacterium sp. SB3]|uniref:hypothetical protein n=1 Tax=Phyllobacterium sp. SB3 TaxID=3156073 RepID=UPI0032AFD7C6